MLIDRESNVTLSGDFSIGAVELKDHDSELRANVTQAGVSVDIWSGDVIGDSLQVAIDDTERRLDCTPLASFGYPMRLELDIRDQPCYIKQGDASVSLTGVKAKLRKNDWRIVTMSGVDQSYLAVQTATPTTSGTLVATRIDTM